MKVEPVTVCNGTSNEVFSLLSLFAAHPDEPYIYFYPAQQPVRTGLFYRQDSPQIEGVKQYKKVGK